MASGGGDTEGGEGDPVTAAAVLAVAAEEVEEAHQGITYNDH